MNQTLSQAAGAYVRPQQTERRLSVLPRYPAAPWQWNATPTDVLIPPDIMPMVCSELMPGQGGDGIQISGGEQGVTTLVTLNGGIFKVKGDGIVVGLKAFFGGGSCLVQHPACLFMKWRGLVDQIKAETACPYRALRP